MKTRVPKMGLVIASLIVVLVISALAALLMQSAHLPVEQLWQDPYLRHVTWFSFLQASLSTILSVGLAIPVAHALSRSQFRGRNLVLKIFSSTLVLPVLVGVFGLLTIYGNRGYLASLLSALGVEHAFSIYGLGGILLAHVFFNLPYAARLLLQGLESIPHEQHLLAAHLGMSSMEKFRTLEWPWLRQQVPAIAGLVFMLCFTSFATVMALGGGPKSTTIELAIYQAIKFDFDLATGAILAIWQMLLCGTMAILLQKGQNALPSSQGATPTEPVTQFQSRRAQYWNRCWIGLAIVFVIPPLLSVIHSGLNPKWFEVMSDSRYWHAMLNSFKVASLASVLAVCGAVFIQCTSRYWRLREYRKAADHLDLVATIILVTPGLVLSTGLFLLLRYWANAFDYAFEVVVLINGLMALPYTVKSLAQPMFKLEQDYQYLCQSLGLTGWQRWCVVEWRALRAPLAHALAISFMFSLGDLSVVALFGSADFATLPFYLYQLLGSYQTSAAAVVALTLLLLSLVCFTLSEQLLKPRAKKVRGFRCDTQSACAEPDTCDRAEESAMSASLSVPPSSAIPRSKAEPRCKDVPS